MAMELESEGRVSDAVRVIERGGHPHHEAMAAVMARILASATPPGPCPGSVSQIQGGRMIIKQNIKRKRRKIKNGNMEAEGSSDHGSSSDEEAGSDSGSTCVHSAGPPLVTDVVMQCHRSPLDWDVEGERQLQRMATRGVVQLFNAVSKQQKIIEKKAKEAGASERKRSKVLKSIDKGSFIDMLKTAGAGDSEKTNRTARTTISSPSLAESGGSRLGGVEVEQPDWNVLKDGYFTKKPGAAAASSSMLDWKEEEEGEGDSSSLEDSFSHLHEL